MSTMVILWIFVAGIFAVFAQEPACINLDDDQSCDKWALEAQCDFNPWWMVHNCRSSCHACAEFGCFDDKNMEEVCSKWAFDLKCKTHPEYKNMSQTQCKRSCGFCVHLPRITSSPALTTAVPDNVLTSIETPGELKPAACINLDGDQSCDKWALEGQCNLNPAWMVLNCRLSCHACAEFGCFDDKNLEAVCSKWASFDLQCKIHPDYKNISQTQCKRSCGFCVHLPRITSSPALTTAVPDNVLTSIETPGELKPAACFNLDDDQSCDKWALEGQCNLNPAWMVLNCRLSCHACAEFGCFDDKNLEAVCSKWASFDLQCKIHPDYKNISQTQCKRSCGFCVHLPRNTSSPALTTAVPDNVLTSIETPGESKSTACLNLHDDQRCDEWALEGKCDFNPAWMVLNCRLSCHACAEFGCFDHANVELTCSKWAFDLRCITHQDYKNLSQAQCQRSCGFCVHLTRSEVLEITSVSNIEAAKNTVESSGEDDMFTSHPAEDDFITVPNYSTGSGDKDLATKSLPPMFFTTNIFKGTSNISEQKSTEFALGKAENITLLSTSLSTSSHVSDKSTDKEESSGDDNDNLLITYSTKEYEISTSANRPFISETSPVIKNKMTPTITSFVTTEHNFIATETSSGEEEQNISHSTQAYPTKIEDKQFASSNYYTASARSVQYTASSDSEMKKTSTDLTVFKLTTDQSGLPRSTSSGYVSSSLESTKSISETQGTESVSGDDAVSTTSVDQQASILFTIDDLKMSSRDSKVTRRETNEVVKQTIGLGLGGEDKLTSHPLSVTTDMGTIETTYDDASIKLITSSDSKLTPSIYSESLSIEQTTSGDEGFFTETASGDEQFSSMFITDSYSKATIAIKQQDTTLSEAGYTSKAISNDKLSSPVTTVTQQPSTTFKPSQNPTSQVIQENSVKTESGELLTTAFPHTTGSRQQDITFKSTSRSFDNSLSTLNVIQEGVSETGSGEEELFTVFPTLFLRTTSSRHPDTTFQSSSTLDNNLSTSGVVQESVPETASGEDKSLNTTPKSSSAGTVRVDASNTASGDEELFTITQSLVQKATSVTASDKEELFTASSKTTNSHQQSITTSQILSEDKLITLEMVHYNTTESASGEDELFTTTSQFSSLETVSADVSETASVNEELFTVTQSWAQERTSATLSGKGELFTASSKTTSYTTSQIPSEDKLITSQMVKDNSTESASGEDELFTTTSQFSSLVTERADATETGSGEYLLTIFPTMVYHTITTKESQVTVDVTEAASGSAEGDVTEMFTESVESSIFSSLPTTGGPSPGIGAATIYFSNETTILKRENGATTSVIKQENGNIVGLAVDKQTNALFWSNNAYGYKGIYRGNVDGTSIERIVSSDIYEVNGLALDTSTKLLFWTDAQRKCIKVSRYDGQTVKTVIRTGLKTPRGIAVDTINGYIYWNDQGTRKIERSRYDGSSRETILQGDQVYWPNQMAISEDGLQLMWVDAWLQKLHILNIGTRSIKAIDISKQTNGSPAFGLAVIDNTAYISIWGNTKLVTFDLLTENMDILESKLGSDVMFSITVEVDISASNSNPCQSNNGGCSHLCLNTGRSTYKCACPDIGGLLLSKDNKTCQNPDDFLLFARLDTGEVCMMPPEHSSADNNIAILGRSSKPVGVAYDPIAQHVYWSDVQERQIYKSRLGGHSKEVFLNSSHGLGFVEGLYLDWQHRKLYFTNADFVTIDGTAFSWHKIEVIDIDTMTRRQIVTSVKQPRGLYVDSVNGHLYYTDIDENEPKVMRCNLDGSNPTIIMTSAQDVQVPNGVVYRNGQLYVVDSYYNYQEKGDTAATGKLFSINPINNSLLKIVTENVKIPFAMTMSSDKLYISDWGKRSVLEVHPSTGQVKEILTDIDEATGILYAVRKEVYSNIVEVPCNKTCGGLCLKEDVSVYDCFCDTYRLSWMGSNQNQQCSASDNFVIVSDLNAIKYKAIEAEGNKDNTAVYTLHEGNKYFSSFVAMGFDKTNQIVYYSDVNRGTIEKYDLQSTTHTIMYQGTDIVDDLVLTSSHMYWTSELDGCIRRAPLHNMSLVADVMCYLNKPRSLALANMVGYLYWSEKGTNPSVWRARMDGGSRREIWSANGSIPNDIFFESNRFAIYILDSGNKKIVECNLDGSFCVDYFKLPGNGPYFGLQKQGDFIYYSDWGTHSIMMYNVKDQYSKVLVGDLIRPTKFVVIHPSAISDNCHNSECTDRCKAYPGGYMCTCFDGRTQINKLTCVSADQETTGDHNISVSVTTEQESFGNITTAAMPSSTISLEATSSSDKESSTSKATTQTGEAGTLMTGDIKMSTITTEPPTKLITTQTGLNLNIKSTEQEHTTAESVKTHTSEKVMIQSEPTKASKFTITGEDKLSTAPFSPTTSGITTHFVSTIQPDILTSSTVQSSVISEKILTTITPNLKQTTSLVESVATSDKFNKQSTQPELVQTTVPLLAVSTQEELTTTLTTEKHTTTQTDRIDTTLPKIILTTGPNEQSSIISDVMTTVNPTTMKTRIETTVSESSTIKRTTLKVIDTTSSVYISTDKVKLTTEKMLTTSPEIYHESTLPGIEPTTRTTGEIFTSTIPKAAIQDTTLNKRTTAKSDITSVKPDTPVIDDVTKHAIETTFTIDTTVIDFSKPVTNDLLQTTYLPIISEQPNVAVTKEELTTARGLVTTLSNVSPELRFLYCPGDMDVFALNEKKQVWWKEPAVIPDPFVNEKIEITSNYNSGDEIPVGKTEVVYDAVLTKYGTRGNCSFNVNVTKQDFTCSQTPVIQNGDLSCDHTNFIYGCKAKCNSGFLNIPPYDQTYICKTSGWEPSFPSGYGQLACKREVTNSTSIDIVITFPGLCADIASTDFQNSFKEQISNILKTSGICSMENLYQFCNSQLYSLQCHSGQKKKRAINNEKINLVVKIWYPNSEPTESEIYTALKPLEDIVNAGLVEVTISRNDYIASSVIAYINNVTQCPPGSIQESNHCVLCPSGSYYKASTTTCEPCSQGYYQTYEGQDSCVKCPGSSLTEVGAFLEKQCKSKVTDKTTDIPTGTKENKILPLVIGLSVAGGLLFLAAIALAAYTCHRVFRRKKGEILFDHEKMAAKYKNRIYSHSQFVAHSGDTIRNGKGADAIPQYKGTNKKYVVDKYHPPPKSKPQIRIQTRSPTNSMERIVYRNNNNPRDYSNPKAWSPSPTGSLEKVPYKTHMKPEEYVIFTPSVPQAKPPVRKMAPVLDKYEMKRMKVGKPHGAIIARSKSPPQKSQPLPLSGVYVKRRQEPRRYYMVDNTGWKGLSEAEKATH